MPAAPSPAPPQLLPTPHTLHAPLRAAPVVPQDLEKASEEWSAWCLSEAPERALMPGDWGRVGEFRKLLLLRALRPDRITNALQVGPSAGNHTHALAWWSFV